MASDKPKGDGDSVTNDVVFRQRVRINFVSEFNA